MKTDPILAAARAAGYSVWEGSRLTGTHPVSLDQVGSKNFYMVSVDHTLPELLRDKLRSEHTLMIIGMIVSMGFGIDHDNSRLHNGLIVTTASTVS